MKPLLFLAMALLFHVQCRRGLDNTIKISGKAQGTTYQITYVAGAHSNFRQAIDSIFNRIDLSLSTYLPHSIISRVNQNDPTVEVDDHFKAVFNKSIEVSEKTNGLFDVTVAPLINAYGFGFTKKEKVNQLLIDSIRNFVGYRQVRVEGNKLIKSSPKVMLDFNAIAQGYTVDVLADFLERKGLHNYLIELGGEIRANGKKQDNTDWSIGIENPDEAPSHGVALYSSIKIRDMSLATSGNYKKFYVEDGKKFTHIVNPHTGLPAKNNLLSATVFATDCMTADAYATAFMVMGLEQAKQFLSNHKDLKLEILFIYDDNGSSRTFLSEGAPNPGKQ